MVSRGGQDFARLEAMIDESGLGDVLDALAEICEEKAEHVESNWQDRSLARLWTRAGAHVRKSAKSSAVKALP